MKTYFKIAAVALAATAAISSHADSSYPAAGKTVTIIVPFTAGGPPTRSHAIWPSPCAST